MSPPPPGLMCFNIYMNLLADAEALFEGCGGCCCPGSKLHCGWLPPAGLSCSRSQTVVLAKLRGSSRAPHGACKCPAPNNLIWWGVGPSAAAVWVPPLRCPAPTRASWREPGACKHCAPSNSGGKGGWLSAAVVRLLLRRSLA